MIIIEYFQELWLWLLYCLGGILSFSVVIFLYSKEYYYKLGEPYCKLMHTGFFLYTGVFEVLYSYLCLTFLYVFCITVMFVVYNMYGFIVTGIFHIEKKKIQTVLLFLIIEFLLFCVLYSRVLLKICYFYMGNFSTIGEENEFMFVFEPKVQEYFNNFVYFFVLSYVGLVMPFNFILYLVYWKGDGWILVLYWSYYYCLLILVILFFFPPDFLIHIIVFGLVFLFVESLVFFYLIYEEYLKITKSVWWNR